MAKSSAFNKEARAGYLFVLAPVFQFVAFILGPLLFSLYASFTDWDGISGMKFIGLSNFKDIFADERFWTSLYNTVFYMIGIPIGMILAILLALAMNRKMFGVEAFRAIYYIPVVSSVTAVSILWLWIYNGDYGLLNQVLSYFGIKGAGWLAQPETVKPAIIAMCVWKGVGYTILLYLAGIKSISPSYYEAAQLDGASPFQMLRKITIPLLRPITFFVMVTGIIGGFQIYTEPQLMTSGGGPDYAAAPVVYYLWQKAFVNYQMGYASAVAWILAILIFIVTFIQFRFSSRFNYDVD